MINKALQIKRKKQKAKENYLQKESYLQIELTPLSKGNLVLGLGPAGPKINVLSDLTLYCIVSIFNTLEYPFIPHGP